MEKMNVSEFHKELNAIELLQNEVDKILKMHWFIRGFYLAKAIEVHSEIGERMFALFQKELVIDAE